MLIHTLIEATRKAAHEYFSWRNATRLSPTTREAQSRRARHELLRLGGQLLQVLPEPAALTRFLEAITDGVELNDEIDRWHEADDELTRVHDEPRLARGPRVPVVFWSRKWGWQHEWRGTKYRTGTHADE